MTTITRELQWFPPGATQARTLRVSVTLPEPHPSLGYQCTLTVDGFDWQEPHPPGTFCDHDGMVALTSALNMVPHVIGYHVRRAGGGRVTPDIGGENDLDLLEADRTLEYLAPGAAAAVPINVAFSPPFQNHDETWTCVLSVTGLGDDHERSVHHADSIGAIAEALYLAPIVLRELIDPGGRLTFRGSQDLAFPVRPSGTALGT